MAAANQTAPKTGNGQPGFGKGVVVGLAIVVAGLAIVAAVMFLAMGRCPMCGGMM